MMIGPGVADVREMKFTADYRIRSTRRVRREGIRREAIEHIARCVGLTDVDDACQDAIAVVY
ncbi:MAG: hypothetical protein AMXMBFR13_40520 [Phycisphaerae bacterium]